jgi:hypothetical protein
MDVRAPLGAARELAGDTCLCTALAGSTCCDEEGSMKNELDRE